MTGNAPKASESTFAEAAWPPEQVPGGQQRIVVGLDGSAAAQRALLFAAGEARVRDAVLHVVAAHDLVVHHARLPVTVVAADEDGSDAS